MYLFTVYSVNLHIIVCLLLEVWPVFITQCLYLKQWMVRT